LRDFCGFGPINGKASKSISGEAAQLRLQGRDASWIGSKRSNDVHHDEWMIYNVQDLDRTAKNSKTLWRLLGGSIILLTNKKPYIGLIFIVLEVLSGLRHSTS
jgi:hypothetical protein